jgi:hypothetical protein
VLAIYRTRKSCRCEEFSYWPNSTPANCQLPSRANATHFSTVMPLLLESDVLFATRIRLLVLSEKQPWLTKFPTLATAVGVGRGEELVVV